MSNLTEVLDYLDCLTEDTIQESIDQLRTDIERRQKLLEMLELLRKTKVPKSNGYDLPCSNGHARVMGLTEPVKVSNPLSSQQEVDNQEDAIHTFLMANGPAHVVKISRSTNIHHRRVDKILRDNENNRFKALPNGEYQAK